MTKTERLEALQKATDARTAVLARKFQAGEMTTEQFVNACVALGIEFAITQDEIRSEP